MNECMFNQDGNKENFLCLFLLLIFLLLRNASVSSITSFHQTYQPLYRTYQSPRGRGMSFRLGIERKQLIFIIMIIIII